MPLDLWLGVIQTVCLVIGVPAVWLDWKANRDNAEAVRIQTVFALTDRHREIWSWYSSDSKLSRVLEPKIDLARNPVTKDEHAFVKVLVAHVASSWAAQRAGILRPHQSISRDVGSTFSLPIPNAVWNSLVQFQDEEFVAYVSEAILGIWK